MIRKRLGARVIAIVAAIATLAFISLQPNLASASQDNYIARTMHCLGLLVNDADAHARECAGKPVGTPSSIGGTGSGSGPNSEDPCPPRVSGNAGNAGNAGNSGTIGGGGQLGGGGEVGGNPCNPGGFSSTGHLAPFIAELFAMVFAPAALDEAVPGTDAG